MALLAKTSRAARAGSLGPFAAGLAPLLYCVLRAAPFAQPDSSAVLIAALGEEAHALRTPTTLLAKLCTLVPLGSLALRVSCATAIAFAIAARTLYRSIDILLRAQGVAHDALIQPLALGVTLFVFATPALLVQGTLPETYALQMALALLCLSRVAELEASWPARDLRALYAAAVSFGLCAANDLRSALVLLPATLPTLSRVLHAKGGAPLSRALGLALLAALGMQGAALVAGGGLPETLAASTGPGVTAPVAIVRAFAQELGLFALLVAFGTVAALQTPGVRRIAVLWTTACIAPVLLYGLFARAPEPQLGLGLIAYTLPAAAVLAAALPGALLAPDGRSRPTVNRGQLVPLLLLVLIGALRLHEGALQARPADSTWLDAFSERGAQQLPAHALLLFQDAARAHAQQAVEHETQTRPDLQRLPLSALQHGTRDAALLENDADLRGLLRAYLLEGELSTAELQSLAARRSVALDIDARVSPVLYPALRPSHLFYEVADAQVSPAEQHAASTALHDDLGALRDLARAESHDTGTRERLSELAWCVALYFAGRGARDEARATIADARELTPTHSRWDALSALLAAPPEHGPVDVHTLLPDSAEPLSPSR